MAELTKLELEAQNRSRFRTGGQGGLTKAEDARRFNQHAIDTFFGLADTTALENLIASLQSDVSDLQTEITAIQSTIQNETARLDLALTQIQNNQTAISALQSLISNAQRDIQTLNQSVNSNRNLITNLQAQIDTLTNQKAPVQTFFDTLTLSAGTTIFPHNFDLSNLDAWQISAKMDGEVVFLDAKTRDKDSIFITVNQTVTLTIFITAKLD